MARVKTFRIHARYGVPDKDISEFLKVCEREEGFINVNTVYIPALEKSDPRLTVIVTKLDDVEQEPDPHSVRSGLALSGM